MKKFLPFLAALLFVSCVSTGPFVQETSGEKALIISAGGESSADVYRQVDMNENSVIEAVRAGTIVDVIRRSSSAALIRLHDGKTGWIDIKFVKEGK